MAEETLDPAQSRRGDTHEGLYFGRHVDEGSPEAELPLHGPNQWPAESLVPGYRAATEAYQEAVTALGFRLLRLLALALGLPPDHFAPFFTRPMAFLRPLHYSAERSSEAEGLYAAGAHCDYGCLTLLATDGVPGLQICTDGATWRDVPPIAGALHMNLGDMLARWTNNRFRSTLHRVVNTQGRERFSIAFFFEPNFDAVVEALPQVRRQGVQCAECAAYQALRMALSDRCVQSWCGRSWRRAPAAASTPRSAWSPASRRCSRPPQQARTFWSVTMPRIRATARRQPTWQPTRRPRRRLERSHGCIFMLLTHIMHSIVKACTLSASRYTLGTPTTMPGACCCGVAGGGGAVLACGCAPALRAGGGTCFMSWKYSTTWPGSSASSCEVKLSTVSRCMGRC